MIELVGCVCLTCVPRLVHEVVLGWPVKEQEKRMRTRIGIQQPPGKAVNQSSLFVYTHPHEPIHHTPTGNKHKGGHGRDRILSRRIRILIHIDL